MNDTKQVAIEAIKKKLLGKKITYNEAFAIMDEFSHRRLSDIFVAYFAASSFNNGFSETELGYLIKAMVETGNKLDFRGIVADKHSIGGMPGTRTTPIIVSIIAAAGYRIPKVSSRAITTPAGTADVMETLCEVNFTLPEIKSIVNEVGGCIVWNGKLNMAPADDIIIRVEEPLSFESFDKIIVSILAKKVAMSSNLLILDIPIGPTMKIKYVKDALKFKRKFVSLCEQFKINVKVDINHQLEPLGDGIGASLEARDVLKVLEQQPERSLKLENKSLKLASRLLDMCYVADHKKEDGLKTAEYLLQSGKAEKKFREIIKAQRGNPDIRWHEIKFGQFHEEIKAETGGTVKSLNNFHISSIAKILGAPAVKTAGLVLHKKLDEKVVKNDILMELFSESKDKLAEARISLKNLPIYFLS